MKTILHSVRTRFVMTAFGLVALSLPLHAQVTNTIDSGPGSLRQAIADATSGDTITFTNTLSGQTINLTSGQIQITNSLTIDASPLAGGLTIDGNTNGRIFEIVAGSTNVFNSLTITGGRAPDGAPGSAGHNGGGILNSGQLTFLNVTITNNAAGAVSTSHPPARSPRTTPPSPAIPPTATVAVSTASPARLPCTTRPSPATAPTITEAASSTTPARLMPRTPSLPGTQHP